MAEPGPVLPPTRVGVGRDSFPTPESPARHHHPSTLVWSPISESGPSVSTATSRNGATTVVLPSPPQDHSTPSSSLNQASVSGQLRISTDSSHYVNVSTNSTSGYPLLTSQGSATGEQQSPSSLQTSSSYRSPTKWTNFEEDSDVESGEESPHSPSTPGAFARMDRQNRERSGSHQSVSSARHDSFPFGEEGHSGGAGSLAERTVSSDAETRNLLDPDAMSESDAQSLFEGSEDPYVMSEEQRSYYREYFRTLLKETQGIWDAAGALRGADKAVQDFFHKSKLDRDALRKIWELADVNKDGWLNLEEFSICMHLIVLHVKGNLLIPDYLPPHVAPPVTPVRGEDGSKGGWHNFEEHSGSSSNASRNSRTGPLVSPSPKNREFTNHPPTSGTEKPVALKMSPEAEMVLTVSTDSTNHNGGVVIHQAPAQPTPPRRRTHTEDSIHKNAAMAIANLENQDSVYNVPSSPSAVPASAQKKASTMPMSPPNNAISLTPQAPKGPPPKPPPRPVRGHVRSASLDLANTAFSSTGPRVPPPIGAPPPPVASRAAKQINPPSGDFADGDRTDPSIPPEEALPPLPSTATHPTRFTTTVVHAGTQTQDLTQPDVGLSRNRNSAAPPMLDLEDDEDTSAADDRPELRPSLSIEDNISGPPGSADFRSRVKKLKKANAELEKERAKLADMRLQLELKLQGFKLQKK